MNDNSRQNYPFGDINIDKTEFAQFGINSFTAVDVSESISDK